MHELGIALQLVEVATERACGARVKKIVLEVGMLSAVLPDALRFCFDLATEGTPAEGATLDIIEVPGRARGRGCDARIELRRPFGRCACGGTDLEWLSGEQLALFALEVE